jgi:tungstate transport system substrate-binding protein
MKKWLWIGLLCMFIPCQSLAQGGKFILMASTIGPIDSGVIGVLEDQFENDTGIQL